VRTRTALRAATVTAALALSSCTVLPLYFAAFTCKSPDGRSEVRILRNFPGSDAEYRFRVEVHTEREERVIYREDRGSDIRLVEANWSQGGKRVGLLVCNWQRPLILGYDIPSRRLVDPSAFRGLIEEQLRRKYDLSGIHDVIYWACTAGGHVYPPKSGR
jgi:hypothetical protein